MARPRRNASKYQCPGRAAIWDHLNYQLLTRSTEAEVRRWCESQGLEYGLPARLAHLLLLCHRRGEVSARNRTVVRFLRRQPKSEQLRLLPRLPSSSSRLQELLQWRFPGWNISLLQLSLLARCSLATRYLWRPALDQAADCHRDDRLGFLNHPLHLAVCTNSKIPGFVAEEHTVLTAVGTVDIIGTRTEPLDPKRRKDANDEDEDDGTQDCSTPPRKKRRLHVEESEDEMASIARDFHTKVLRCSGHSAGGVSGTPAQLASRTRAWRALTSLIVLAVKKIVTMESGPQRRSLVQGLWDLLEVMHAHRVPCCLFADIALSGPHVSDILLLKCHMLLAAPPALQPLALQDLLAEFILYARAAEEGQRRDLVAILRRFLPQTAMRQAIEHIDTLSSCAASDEKQQLLKLREVLEGENVVESLKNKCILAVLINFGGDAQKARTKLQDEIGPLEFFPSPFQTLNDKSARVTNNGQ